MRISDWSSDVCSSDLRITERSRHGRLPFDPVVIAIGADERGMQVLRRLARGDVDRAADDILAEQRALRSAQNLDALDVEQQGVAIFGPAEIDAIDEQSVRRIGARRAVISANAPNGKRSEEHTSELQSLMRISYTVFCLENKKDTL